MDHQAMLEALKKKRGGGFAIILGEPEIHSLGKDKGSELAPEASKQETTEAMDPNSGEMPKEVPGDSAMNGKEAEMSPEEKFKQLFGGDLSDAAKLEGPPKSLQERAAKEYVAKYKKV